MIACSDPTADNYNSAWITAGSSASLDTSKALVSFTTSSTVCQYAGCNETAATNYDSRATFNDGTCVYPRNGCMDPTATTRITQLYSRRLPGCLGAALPPAPPAAALHSSVWTRELARER